MKTVFSYSANLGHKYPLHVAVCLQNLVYFQLSLREIRTIVLNMYNALLPCLLISLK